MLNKFIPRVKKEWAHIDWLSSDEVKKQTGIAVAGIVFLGVAIAAVDFLGQWLVNFSFGFHF